MYVYAINCNPWNYAQIENPNKKNNKQMRTKLQQTNNRWTKPEQTNQRQRQTKVLITFFERTTIEVKV